MQVYSPSDDSPIQTTLNNAVALIKSENDDTQTKLAEMLGKVLLNGTQNQQQTTTIVNAINALTTTGGSLDTTATGVNAHTTQAKEAILSAIISQSNGSLFKLIEAMVAAEVAKIKTPVLTKTQSGLLTLTRNLSTGAYFDTVTVSTVENTAAAQIKFTPVHRHTNVLDMMKYASYRPYFVNSTTLHMKKDVQDPGGQVHWEIWESK